MTLTDTTAPTTPDAAAAWSVWHAEREAGLTGQHGWLTLTGLHRLTATPSTLAGLPGLWWADEDGAHVRAVAADGLRTSDTRNGVEAGTEALDGEHTVVVPEAGSTLAALTSDDVAAEVALRTGGYIVRVRDPKAPARTQFSGVPTYAYDPAWVIDAPVRWYDAPQPETVGGAQPGLVHQTTVVGEVDLTVDGTTQTLRVVGASAGSGAILFSDATTDTAEWRILSVDPTAQGDASPGTVRLDLNRTINLPFAFSDYGTCPRPVAGNALTVAVTAGERLPR